MNTWVQLKDGVAFANVQSNGFVEGSILLEEGISWEDVKGKKYNNGEWSIAPLIYFVSEVFENKVLNVNSTIFESDVTGDICSSEVKAMWTKNEEGTFIPPATIEEATVWDENLFS